MARYSIEWHATDEIEVVIADDWKIESGVAVFFSGDKAAPVFAAAGFKAIAEIDE